MPAELQTQCVPTIEGFINFWWIPITGAKKGG